MIYLIIIFLIIVSLRTLSFAKYIWGSGNKQGSISVIILTVITFTFPVILAYIRS